MTNPMNNTKALDALAVLFRRAIRVEDHPLATESTKAANRKMHEHMQTIRDALTQSRGEASRSDVADALDTVMLHLVGEDGTAKIPTPVQEAMTALKSAVGVATGAQEPILIPPREPSETMMQAGLYHSSRDATWADIYTVWTNMWDFAFRDDATVPYTRPVVTEAVTLEWRDNFLYFNGKCIAWTFGNGDGYGTYFLSNLSEHWGQTIEEAKSALFAAATEWLKPAAQQGKPDFSGYFQVPSEPSPIKSPHSAGVFPKPAQQDLTVGDGLGSDVSRNAVSAAGEMPANGEVALTLEQIVEDLHLACDEAGAISMRIAGPRGKPNQCPDGVQVLEDAETIIRAVFKYASLPIVEGTETAQADNHTRDEHKPSPSDTVQVSRDDARWLVDHMLAASEESGCTSFFWAVRSRLASQLKEG